MWFLEQLKHKGRHVLVLVILGGSECLGGCCLDVTWRAFLPQFTLLLWGDMNGHLFTLCKEPLTGQRNELIKFGETMNGLDSLTGHRWGVTWRLLVAPKQLYHQKIPPQLGISPPDLPGHSHGAQTTAFINNSPLSSAPIKEVHSRPSSRLPWWASLYLTSNADLLLKNVLIF